MKKAMGNILQELHGQTYKLWLRNNKKAVTEADLRAFLSTRILEIPEIITLCEQAKLIVRVPGTDTYLPRPRGLNPNSIKQSE